MKTLSVIVLVIAAVLLSGCTTAPSGTTGMPQGNGTLPLPPAPNLVGNWTGTMAGYTEGSGYYDFSNQTLVLSVTEQHGRVFSGTAYFLGNGTVVRTKGFAGVLGRDGRTFSMAETSGYTHGTLVTPDDMEIIYTDDNSPFVVAIDTLKRS